ncbi:hypothetical protein A1O3_02745 [Capronia epimyces CBS 606.96]|uniref:Uncharacterized protein n=1 Tax=Capronia epimyces CBS 606.96 TaxID=1182542 RepID=W9YAX4_9EURO|nr:uncharacterized protein A1O3_02745 [Capronia epimyces CBS 606.96]EXJ89678.1 hypothetical protein A1O3_02745 [Capronia epimyces CBS 606.96]
MTVQHVHCGNPALDGPERELLSQKLRFNLLGLKEFEQCHILARWIRQLFLLALDRSRTNPRPFRSSRPIPCPDPHNNQRDRAAATPVSGQPLPTAQISYESEQLHGGRPDTIASLPVTGLDSTTPDCTASLGAESLLTPEAAPFDRFFPEVDVHFGFWSNPELMWLQASADEFTMADSSGWFDHDFSRPANL